MTKPNIDDVIGGLRRELEMLQEQAQNAGAERDKWARRAAVYQLMAETVADILDRQASSGPYGGQAADAGMDAGLGAAPPAWKTFLVLPTLGPGDRPLGAICATVAPYAADAGTLAKLSILS
jgi:hypothetical protein